MGFEQYLAVLLGKNRVFESTKPIASPIDFAKNQVSGKIGGDPNDQVNIQTAFEAIEQSLDVIPFDYFKDETNVEMQELFKLLIDKDKIEFFEKYAKKEEASANSIVNEIKKLDIEKNGSQYRRYIDLYGAVADRLQKIYVFIQTHADLEINEAVAIDDDTKKKLKEIMLASSGGMASFKNVISSAENKINLLPNNEEGADRLSGLLELLKLLGLSDLLKNQTQRKKEALPKERTDDSSITISNRKTTLRKIFAALRMSELPLIEDGVIQQPGDYFQLFATLKEKNQAWMNKVLEKKVFGEENTVKLQEFRTKAEGAESPLEEHQLIYLKASGFWIQEYIDSQEEINGKITELNDRDRERATTELKSEILEKEKEIKNYYLSKDFSLGNFGGLQIKPEVRLPLYTKVDLAVSEEDRKKESPLQNLISGAKSIVGGIFGAIPTTIDQAALQAAKRRNAAIFNGINSIIRAGVTAVGGKQAGRDYAEAMTKAGKKIGIEAPEATSGKKIKEDMLAISDSPGFIPVNPEVPGQIMQTPAGIAGGMDTMSLAGPQRKTSTKKKKKAKKGPTKVENRVASFKDFMQRS